jgi:hypothetical protein
LCKVVHPSKRNVTRLKRRILHGDNIHQSQIWSRSVTFGEILQHGRIISKQN